MRIYLRILAALYLVGAILHCADLLDLRLKFSEMNGIWKTWIIYLAVADTIAAVGLWRQTRWGVGLFLLIAFSQLVAYTVFRGFFGEQTFLIVFHLVTLAIFFALKTFLNSTLIRKEEI